MYACMYGQAKTFVHLMYISPLAIDQLLMNYMKIGKFRMVGNRTWKIQV